MKIGTKLAAAVTALLATTAHATATLITDPARFTAAGTITESFDFDSFPGGYTVLGIPYTRGSVTFLAENLIVGTGYYGTPKNTIGNNYWTPLHGTIAGNHNLLAFNLTFWGSGEVNITLGTNRGSYTFANVSAPFEAFAFQGFQADPGEYFESFSVDALNGYMNLPMATDFQLGTAVGGVPEPAEWALMIGGFVMVGFAARYRTAARPT